MLSYCLLLIAAWLFGMGLQSGLTTFSMIDYKNWDDDHKKIAKSKAWKVIVFFGIVELAIGYYGWSLKGNWFLLWFILVLILNYIQEKKYIKRKIKESNNIVQ